MSGLTLPGHLSAKTLAAAIVIFILLFALARQTERIYNPAMSVPTAARVAAPSASLPRTAADYGKLPISFEVNQGQADRSVQFLARGAGYALFLTPGEAVLSLHASPPAAAKTAHLAVQPHVKLPPPLGRPASALPPSTVRLQLIGSNTKAEVEGVDPLPGKSNYFTGNDPARWHANVPTYGKVRYSNIYPGIDLVYYGNQEGRLEHDFVLAPGANPNDIAIGLHNDDGAVPDNNGGLMLHTKAGDLTLRSPLVYQIIGGQRKPIPATYLLANNQIRFQLGIYDRNAPLVIDPVLKFATLISGSDMDIAYSIAVNSSGEAYIGGQTYSTDFPVKNAVIPSNPTTGRPWVDFITKLNAAGTALVYSTYFGGAEGESNGDSIAVDHLGAAYLAGITSAPDFPVTANAYQTKFGGFWDATVTKLSASGKLVYSTFLGGKDADHAYGIAVDQIGSAYITGNTGGDFPTTSNSYKSGKSSGVFAAKLDTSGRHLLYSIVLGGTFHNPESGFLTSSGLGIALDPSGSAYVTGQTDYIPTVNAIQPKFGGGEFDIFVTSISSDGHILLYSTYFGGDGSDRAFGIAVDGLGNAYVGGEVSQSTSGTPRFRTTWNALQKTYGGGETDGILFKLNPAGRLLYSSFLGGVESDSISAIAVDQYGTAYVAGNTYSPDFPLFASIHEPGPGFVATIVPSGELGKSTWYYSTGQGADILGIAIDSALNVYTTGLNDDPKWLPVTKGAFQTVSKGAAESFIAKLVIAADLGLGIRATPAVAVHGQNLTYTLSTRNNGPDWAALPTKFDDPIPPGTSFVSLDAGGGACTAELSEVPVRSPANGSGWTRAHCGR